MSEPISSYLRADQGDPVRSVAHAVSSAHAPPFGGGARPPVPFFAWGAHLDHLGSTSSCDPTGGPVQSIGCSLKWCSPKLA